jgi:hypothetical protein
MAGAQRTCSSSAFFCCSTVDSSELKTSERWASRSADSSVCSFRRRSSESLTCTSSWAARLRSYVARLVWRMMYVESSTISRTMRDVWPPMVIN